MVDDMGVSFLISNFLCVEFSQLSEDILKRLNSIIMNVSIYKSHSMKSKNNLIINDKSFSLMIKDILLHITLNLKEKMNSVKRNSPNFF